MAPISITSNEGKLPSASAVLEVTATNPAYNQPALRIGQASKQAAQPRSGSMIRIPILSLSRPIRSLQQENMKLPFNQTSCRSMAATPQILPSRLWSCFSGEQRAAISAFELRANLDQDRVSSRLQMLLLHHRQILSTVGFYMSRMER